MNACTISKSTKISKKDQDPSQVDKDREALAAMAVESPHFKPGTYVLVNNRRAEVLSIYEAPKSTWLRVKWDDGVISALRPRALNRGK